jgi:hypothetical protein
MVDCYRAVRTVEEAEEHTDTHLEIALSEPANGCFRDIRLSSPPRASPAFAISVPQELVNGILQRAFQIERRGCVALPTREAEFELTTFCNEQGFNGGEGN